MKSNGMSRREFLGAGAVALGAAGMVRWVNAGEGRLVPAPVGGPPVRIAKIYFGTPHPGWPKATVDLAAEHARVEKEMRKVAAGLPDSELAGKMLRAFRSPHHTISDAGLTGGGSPAGGSVVVVLLPVPPDRPPLLPGLPVLLQQGGGPGEEIDAAGKLPGKIQAPAVADPAEP